MRIYNAVINKGTYEGITSIDRHYVKLTNIINLFLIFLIAIPALITNLLFLKPVFISYARFILVAVFCVINLFLNAYHKQTLAKIGTIVFPFFIVFVSPILTGYIVPGMFLWFPVGIMLVGAISFLLFSFEKERRILIIMISAFAVASVFYDAFLKSFAPHLDLSFIYKENFIYYQVVKVFLLVFLYTAFFVFKRSNYKVRVELHHTNNILNQRNNQLEYFNNNLEKLVKERTEKLELQNKRIKELAFTNSHKIRANVARIIGLIQVSKENNASQEEKIFYYSKIEESAAELDKVTRDLSQELIEE